MKKDSYMTLQEMFDLLPLDMTPETQEEQQDSRVAYQTVLSIIDTVNKAYPENRITIQSIEDGNNNARKIYGIVLPFTPVPFMSSDTFDLLSFSLGLKSGIAFKDCNK